MIPCHDDGNYLREAADSVTRASTADVELIVVDDGSTEATTLRVVGELEQAGITVIRQPNRGLAAARNAGIAFSRGAYILPLDADNRIRPTFVERGCSILDAQPGVGVVYGDADYIGERSGRWVVGAFDRRRLMKQNYIDACAMFRREVWERHGGYDGTMPVQGYEDWDLWLGAVEQGWEFEYVPDVTFEYRVRAGSMIEGARSRASEVEAFVARKHGILYRREWLRLVESEASLKDSLRRTISLAWRRLTTRRAGAAAR